jgi:hypothetical protein
MIASLAGLLLLIGGAGEGRFVVPAAGADNEHPPLRALPGSEQKPAWVEVSAKFRGRVRYAQLTFGSPGTKPVTLAVDEISPTEVNLYADVGRTGVIDDDSKIKRKDGLWRFSLEAQVLKGKDILTADRSVVVKYLRFTRSLAIATRGYIEGTLDIDGKKVRYRRIDGDANGLFNDPADQLWLDLDGSGRFAPASERFLIRPVLAIGAKRFAMRADALGKSMALTQLLGEGVLGVHFAKPNLARRVTEWTVTVESKDGTVFTLRSDQANAPAPADSYRLHSVDVLVKDEHDRLWRFIFLDQTLDPPYRWHRLDNKGRLMVDPLAGFEVAVSATITKSPADRTLTLRPEIRTSDGLSLYRCTYSLDSNFVEKRSHMSVRSAQGAGLGDAHSGFT